MSACMGTAFQYDATSYRRVSLPLPAHTDCSAGPRSEWPVLTERVAIPRLARIRLNDSPQLAHTGTDWQIDALVRNRISADLEALDGQLVTGSLKPFSSTTFLVQFLGNPHTSPSIQGGVWHARLLSDSMTWGNLVIVHAGLEAAVASNRRSNLPDIFWFATNAGWRTTGR